MLTQQLSPKKEKRKVTRQAGELEERNPVWFDTFQVCKSGIKKKKEKRRWSGRSPTPPPQPRWDGDLSLGNPEESGESPVSNDADEAESKDGDVRRWLQSQETWHARRNAS